MLLFIFPDTNQIRQQAAPDSQLQPLESCYGRQIVQEWPGTYRREDWGEVEETCRSRLAEAEYRER